MRANKGPYISRNMVEEKLSRINNGSLRNSRNYSTVNKAKSFNMESKNSKRQDIKS